MGYSTSQTLSSAPLVSISNRLCCIFFTFYICQNQMLKKRNNLDKIFLSTLVIIIFVMNMFDSTLSQNLVQVFICMAPEEVKQLLSGCSKYANQLQIPVKIKLTFSSSVGSQSLRFLNIFLCLFI